MVLKEVSVCLARSSVIPSLEREQCESINSVDSLRHGLQLIVA